MMFDEAGQPLEFVIDAAGEPGGPPGAGEVGLDAPG